MDEKKRFEDFDWNQLSLENLKHIQSEVSKAIDIKRRELLTKSTVYASQDYDYKASLVKAYPHRLRRFLSEYDRCVFMVSLGSKNFVEQTRLEACIKWISDNFKNCLVLVCDSIYRLTIQVRQGLKEDEAWLEAISSGKKFVDRQYGWFDKYSENCIFDLLMTSEVEKESDFQIYYEELQSLYRKNRLFESMVNSFSQKYLSRLEWEKLEHKDDIRKQTLATMYLLEESACIACIVKRGWPVFVYPGSIKTFEEITEGLHPEVPEPLKQMIWVSLRLKKRKGAIA